MIPDNIPEAIERLKSDITALRQRIAQESVAPEYVWLRNFLVGILNCALDDYKHVEIGAEKSVPLLAWGRRNLLELRTTVEFILESRANALGFQNDLTLDAKEFYESLTRFHKATHEEYLEELAECVNENDEPLKSAFQKELDKEKSEGPRTEVPEAIAEMYREFLKGIGVPEKAKPKMAGQLAEKLEQQERFSSMNKICSKIMHRTALSIASSTMKNSVTAAIPFLRDSAVSDLAVIYRLIKEHVDGVGIGSWK